MRNGLVTPAALLARSVETLRAFSMVPAHDFGVEKVAESFAPHEALVGYKESTDHVNAVVGTYKHKHGPLIEKNKKNQESHNFLPINEHFRHVEEARSNMSAVVEVVSICIWHCNCRHAWIFPKKSSWPSEEEDVLHIQAHYHEYYKGPESASSVELKVKENNSRDLSEVH